MVDNNQSYQMKPPVLTVVVEDAMDIMIVRDTTRRAASLLGFPPAHRAQLGSAAASLAELVLKTGEVHTINLNGVTDNDKSGLQISANTPWLQGVSTRNVVLALQSKMSGLVHEIHVDQDETPTIIMVMWLDETPDETDAS